MSIPVFKPIKPKTNTIFRGDNLAITRAMPDEFADLIYIDPPFFTQRDYKNIWGDREAVLDFDENFFNGFMDTKDFFEKHIHSDAKGLKAYLEWMRARLVEIYRILKPTGSFYLHLDHHAIHYIKVMLDEIFGYNNFRNEIIWRRKMGSNSTGVQRKFPVNNDTILFYTKSNEYTFNQQYLPYDPDYVKNTYRHDDGDGRGPYHIDNLSAPSYSPTLIYPYKGYHPPAKGWRVCLETMQRLDAEGRLVFPKKKSGRIAQKRYLAEVKGMPIENIWTDIKMLRKNQPETTGWPTQKPLPLLERIISFSSNEGDLVFDCFAGCGTAVHAAHMMKRRWLGIDISPTAIKVNRKRLEEAKAKVEVIDENDLPVAELAKPSREAARKASVA